MTRTAPVEAPQGRDGLSIVEVQDERSPMAAAALKLLADAFPPHERQPIEQIAMEVAEKRIGLLTSYDFHLFAAVDEADEVVAISAGVYLGGVNAGFVTYLAVRPEQRARRLGRRMRTALVEAFRNDARVNEWEDLRWVLGEVRLENPWIARLIRDRDAMPFDLTYYHPGVVPGDPDEEWVLYRQPIGDFRTVIPAAEVRQILYAIWRRGYRIRWPLASEGFQKMLKELEGRESVGTHPGFA
jgi:ribosomal protein S18 acetylase RimI-like enzyme